MTWLILWCKGARIGSFPLSEQNRTVLHRAFRLHLIQREQNRAEIDQAIDNVLNGSKPAHYLAYGPDRRY